VKAWFKKRVVDPLLALLKQGISPEALALSVAFGIGIGIFPVLGISTILLTLLALAFRLNLPSIQLVNYLVSPLQLLLIIPFVRVGEHLLGAAPQPLSISAGFALLSQGALFAIRVLWDAIIHAAIGWALLGPPLIYLLYRGFDVVFKRAALRYGARPDL
jgi:uncharacterized protein (DUF2062 family)